nr:PREDICTED: uncharacterized protein LOC109038907 [Bemisia tabaci]
MFGIVFVVLGSFGASLGNTGGLLENPEFVSNLGKIVANVGVGGALSRGAQKPADDWSAAVGALSNYITGKDAFSVDSMLDYLPVLVSSLTGGHLHYEDKELEDEEEHHEFEHAPFWPPYLEAFKAYWEHFKSSELGEALWSSSHLGSLLRTFVDKDGYFQIDRIFDSMEDHTFRRRWISSLTSFAAEWIKHLAHPATMRRYMNTAQFIGNSFLQSQGYSKAALFDPNRPAASLSILLNAIFKRHFGLQINSGRYIKPAVAYAEDLLRLGERKGMSVSSLSSKDIERKLAESLNEEVIEPLLRVWRAYRYSIKHPRCDRYLICTVSQIMPADNARTGLKPGIKKLTSLVASWFLSRRTGTPFWKFYYAATENYVCEKKFPVDCKGFHEEEEAAGAYRHNEL